MQVITYEDVSPKIANTTMQKMFADGVHKTYIIKPVDGYVLHDKENDTVLKGVEIMNEETGKIEVVDKTILGFVGGSTSCSSNYDFTANLREFYTIPRDDAPLDVSIL